MTIETYRSYLSMAIIQITALRRINLSYSPTVTPFPLLFTTKKQFLVMSIPAPFRTRPLL